MKIRQEDYKKAILIIADKIGMKDSYIKLLESGIGLPKLSEMIVYSMFLKDYDNYIEKDENVFDSYYHIKDYCKELNLNGFVNFP